MLFHYALVDDLISKEEFERRVETKIEECGDLIDEPTAAMLVVGELGREHVKIKGLSGKSSLFSFFGKVIDKTEPKEFDRADGEKGWVATLLLGDETGTARVVLWDEKAAAVAEIAQGDVLEIIGRHSKKSTKEINVLALRKASCLIECSVAPNGAGSLSTEPVDLDVLILAIEEPRTYTRRDGTTGEMVEAIVGDVCSTARIVAWVPGLLSNLIPGTSVRITGAKPNTRGEGREYSLDDKSTVTPVTATIAVPFTPLGSVGDQGIYSVKGEVKQVQSPHAFTSRDGSPSWVQNIVITDGNDDLNVAIWGKKALIPLQAGDHIEVYHAPAKAGRFGRIELGAGRGTALCLPGKPSCEIVFEGTVIATQGSTFIDDGYERYLMDGGDIPLWQEVRVTGTMSGHMITPHHWELIHLSRDGTRKKVQDLLDTLKP